MLGGQEGHRQHPGKGASKADYSVQGGRVGLIVLSPATWLPQLVFPQVKHCQVRGVLTAVENVVYVMWCYFTFGTAIINIVADPTQVRVYQGALSSSEVC